MYLLCLRRDPLTSREASLARGLTASQFCSVALKEACGRQEDAERKIPWSTSARERTEPDA